MSILLTGANGMLGSAFAARLQGQAVPADRADLDIRDIPRLRALLDRTAPTLVINCAADVDAEAAESEPRPAIIANVLLPQLLAWECRRRGALLVHFSSTGCYGNWKLEPYTEEDRPQPTTLHHRSKLSGESVVREAACEHLILRTGWLFGGTSMHTKNFVWNRLVEAMSAPLLRSDTGQRGNPTFVEDVVEQTLVLVDAGVRGLFNCVAQGAATRYDYVSRIVAAAGLDTLLEPTGPFNRKAAVSPNETAVNYRLALLGLNQMPEWGASLDRYVAQVTGWPEWAALMLESKPG